LARTSLLFVLTGTLIAGAWLRLEIGGLPFGRVLLMLALAFVPTFAVAVGARRVWVAVLTAAVTVAACAEVFHASLRNARPGGEHDFFGPVIGSFRDGFLNFYDTTLPFRRSDFPLMHGDVLLAIFGFALAAGILIAARRPIGAAVVMVVGVGWPTTLVPGSRPLLVGALALVGVLAVLFLLRSGTHHARGLAQGFAVALVLVAVAAAASTSDSVAKGAFLTWQRWDPYDQPDDPVEEPVPRVAAERARPVVELVRQRAPLRVHIDPRADRRVVAQIRQAHALGAAVLGVEAVRADLLARHRAGRGRLAAPGARGDRDHLVAERAARADRIDHRPPVDRDQRPRRLAIEGREQRQQLAQPLVGAALVLVLCPDRGDELLLLGRRQRLALGGELLQLHRQ